VIKLEKSAIILRFTEGLLNQENYMLLKKLASAYGGYRILILAVSPDDIDMLNDMVTSVTLYLDENALDSVCKDISLMTMVKKLSVATKYIISGFKTVVDFGAGREERECTYSIKTPCAHIHVPLNLVDKKTERYVACGVQKSLELCNEHKSNMLIYYNEDSDRTVIESKDDYVRRIYLESGILNNKD